MFNRFKQIFELKVKLSKAEDRIEYLQKQINCRDTLIGKLSYDYNFRTKSFYKEGVLDLANRLKMQSVLVDDELYITMEESELDGLVKELTGC
jgi:hypothetical protein